MDSEFPSLQDHCLFHLITHINEYSPDNELALLPRHLRLLLLQSVAPVHLVWLERTAVAARIDTDSVWGRFLRYYSNDGLHEVWLNQDGRFSQLQAAPRDLYVSYIYQKLFATTQPLLVHFDVKCLPLAVFLYGLSEPVVGEGILKIVQNNPFSLVGQINSLVCCVPNFTPDLNSFESICCTLLTYNIFPRVLDISLSSYDNLVNISSGKQRPSQLELFFACSAVTEHLSMNLCDRLADDVMTVTRVLSGLGRCGWSQLSTLKLAKVAENTLLSIAPILITQCSYFKLKRLELILFHGRERFIPPLVEILHHQTSLESLSLSFQRTTCGNLGQSLLSSLSQLFTYPNFKDMKLKYLIDFPIAGVISAFLCSLANHQQSLELVRQRIALPSHHPELDFKLPNSEHAHQYGQKKDLIFTNVTASRSFYDWLFSMPTISLNTMKFTHCKVISDGRKNLNLTERLEAHPNASITHFHCKNFRHVRW